MPGIDDLLRTRHHPAADALDRITHAFRQFEADLDEGQEIGVLVGSSLFRIETLKASGDLLVMDGTDEEGRDVRLVQHHTQLSVYMIALPKQQEVSRRLFGFVPEGDESE
jgi:hypothetical protein